MIDREVTCRDIKVTQKYSDNNEIKVGPDFLTLKIIM